MKPKPWFFYKTRLFGNQLRYGAPLAIGFAVFISGTQVEARNILRSPGGGGGGAANASTSSGGTQADAPTASNVDAARANANNILRRTNQTLDAIRAVQNAARAAASAGPNRLANNLPDVPNGLGVNGLNPHADAQTNPTQWWQGADAPVQTVSGENVNVKVKQNAQQALLHWQTLNVGKKTTLHFDQSAGGANAPQWVAFNLINDPSANPTQILGTIKAEGQVYLINPNGIIFGGSSTVNARGLTASSLPINTNLIQQGLLNNAKAEFLFNGLGQSTKTGDIEVRAGAQITSPVGDDGNGGRVFLTGANVKNSGTISAASGQTILAAGLQVGVVAHSTDDPAIRGLDVYVGAISDPASILEPYAGTATNLGLIEAAHGNITLTGNKVNQSGVLENSTSVSLNGSIRLLANYGAVKNTGYDPNILTSGNPFNYTSAGTVTMGESSVTRILPEYLSEDKTTGTDLALHSQIQVQGKNIYMADGSIILAPSAKVSLNAGAWTALPTGPYSAFLNSEGQIYLDRGAEINLAGTTDASASVLQNYLTITLRGSELSVAPLQRDGILRNSTIIVDIRKTGTYNGVDWVGTPLADVGGYLNLIERDISQLTTAGGEIHLAAGGSIVIRDGSKIDVSGGWTNFTGANVQTTKLLSSGRLVDIANATPNQVYEGIYTGRTTATNAKWGILEDFINPLAINGVRYEANYTQGANAGSISIASPSLALDGNLVGTRVSGAYQIRSSVSSSNLASSASLTLKLQAQLLSGSTVLNYFPTHPTVVFSNSKQDDVLDFIENGSALTSTRSSTINLSPSLVSENGFGNLTVLNEGGDVVLPSDIILQPSADSNLSLTAANVSLFGKIVSPGSTLSFTALNLTTYEKDLLTDASNSPLPNLGRGVFTLGSSAVLDTSGSLIDDRALELNGSASIMLAGGSVEIAAYTADLKSGGIVDVSGGYILSATGKEVYGNAGSIIVEAGIDSGKHKVLGGSLKLDSTLQAYSGKNGGTLSLLAPRIQIGGTTQEPDTLLLRPDFFSQGGFSNFKLTGVGVGNSPGVLVTSGSKIEPIIKSLEAVINPLGEGELSLRVLQNPLSERVPVNLTLASPGLKDLTTVETGDVILEEGSFIQTDPGGAVNISGNLVSILGSILTPGGSIAIGGGSTSVFGAGLTDARVTTLLGPNAKLSAVGTTIYIPDIYGRRIGRVLAGGNIIVSGNIAASSGSVLDVSGASAILDITADSVTPTGSPNSNSSGPFTSLASLATVPVRVDSDAGKIVLRGTEVLSTNATLIANAGGATALGGSLTVSSGSYDSTGNGLPSSAINLIVSQTGNATEGTIGSIVGNGGHFFIDSFASGGFDSLTLGGVVSFIGAVDVSARSELNVASNGFLYADDMVHLAASHITLGQSQPVVLPEREISPFSGSVLPTYGSGSLKVDANLIDLGHLSLQRVGDATLNAAGGEIRGSGTVQIAGHLTLQAGQIYPNTASKLTLIAYDYLQNGVSKDGQINVIASGSRSLPLSAGGTLSLYASSISQHGTLRAPFGTINIGWDGNGKRPLDLLAGISAGGNFPITKNLTLGSGSVTSISAIDPTTGKGIIIPYGISTDGENWIDPRGIDITTSGVPEKSISLSGASVTTEIGSYIDLRGGGDLYAYRWVPGLGGPSDVLASPNSFAVIPSYSSAYAPVSEYNTTTDPANLISGQTGYNNPSLKVGDRIYLSGSANLPAGDYTLLPARYALLPGAVLVTPVGGIGSVTVTHPDSSSLVSGYRYNSLNQDRTPSTISIRFEVAPSSVVRARAEYENYFANTFLKTAAQNAGTVLSRLPADSGHLVFQASKAMEILGKVASTSISNGRGSMIDISTPLATVITSASGSSPLGTIRLDSNTLSSFDAESLLIGGSRISDSAGSFVNVSSSSITVDNLGSTLSAQDLILVAKNNLTLADGASVESSRNLSDSDNLTFLGDGALLRVSADKTANILRPGITTNSSPILSIGSAATLKGGSIILDSSSNISLDSKAVLLASSYQFNAGSIALQLSESSVVPTVTGLVLTRDILNKIQSASSLKLQSYSSIDLYGAGSFGSSSSLDQLTLSAGQIRGVDTLGGSVSIAAKNLRLENSASVIASSSNGSLSGSLSFAANSIELGSNQLAINGYSSVLMNAPRGIIGQGSGEISVQGDLIAKTSVIAGAAGANRALKARGIVSFEKSSVSPPDVLVSGLGSSLTVSGGTVNVGTAISLPSGSLTLLANSGDLIIGSLLDVSGTEQRFYDIRKITSAGNINLSSTAGNVLLSPDATLNLASPANGGDGGTLSIHTPLGFLTLNGSIYGAGGNGGKNGAFDLDVMSLPSLATLSAKLNTAKFDESRSIRVRSGDVVIDGMTKTRDFQLTSDLGSITVTGTIDASGNTGGSISLAAHGDLTVVDGSKLTVAGEDFSSAGKGGSITLESGTQLNGIIGTGSLDIQTGSVLDLSVASKIAGSASTMGTSAYNGQFSGKLHLRAPRTAANNDLLVKALNGSIIDASSILVEGYKLYDLTASNGNITSAIQNLANSDSINFLGAAGTTTTNYTNITDRLLFQNSSLADMLVLAPGVEIVNRTGDLTLGTSSSTTTSDWNLSGARYGVKSSPGVLTLKAFGDLVFHNALSDGFTPTLASSDTSWLWTARLAAPNNLLPINTQSWSYRLTAGADLSAAGFDEVLSPNGIAADKGSLKLGKTASNISTTTGPSATTATAIANRFQVIRTGSGDIDINTARDVQILNQFSTIYTAGTRVADSTMDGLFKAPSISIVNSVALGVAQQTYAVQYSLAGGDVNIHAGRDIKRLTLTNGQLVADSQLQMPTNWLYRRGYVDPASGNFGRDRNQTSASTTWWVDFSNFFQGVGALGGGDVNLVAGSNISNVDAVIPTNARMPGYTNSTQTQTAAPDSSKTVELGGGDLTVIAGKDIDAGVYYIERGKGALSAGGSIHTNATRSVLNRTQTITSDYTQLPTTLFLGKGSFDIQANGDVLLGPVANPFLLPAGQLNSFYNKSYFSTYGNDSRVTVGSLGGSVTLRNSAAETGAADTPILQLWYRNKLLLTTFSSAANKPWLRLSETSVEPFTSLFTLQPGSLDATSFSGDLNLVGDLILSPSPKGNVALHARGSIHALNPNGLMSLNGVMTTSWGDSSINLSDADPSAIPGISSPFAYQAVVGTTNSASSTGATDFFGFINQLLAESGGTLGSNVTLQNKQKLHASGILHAGDLQPLRLYAAEGDISGLTLFSPKFSRILAGQDISDVAFYIQNTSAGDTSIVSSGRDLLPYTTSSALRQEAVTGANALNIGSLPLNGDIQISGPGTLQVLAGRNMDLGTGSNNADGTGTGITSIGNTRNPYLPETGANLVVAAGLGSASELSTSDLNFSKFIQDYVLTESGAKLLEEISPGVVFSNLSDEEKSRLALEVFYRIIRDAGRSYATVGNYETAFAAIQDLFGSDATAWDGDILTRSRDIRTSNGGNIYIMTPGGGVTLANTTTGNTLAPPGIITAAGGNISIFANNNVDIGIGRIFTLRGGDEIIWSTTGNIAAGSSSKTVQSASPTRVRLDPQSASVQTDLSGLATGGGIGVLNTVKGVRPGDVDLIAPAGTVDAGDAGIRVSGNLNIAATQVLNAGNISVNGSSIGIPAPVSVGANVGSLTSASTTAVATSSTTPQAPTAQENRETAISENIPTIFTVEVIGYGGDSDPEDRDAPDEEEPES